MSKVLGNIAFIVGIMALTPLTLFLGGIFWVVLPIIAICCGIMGVEPESKKLCILGIIFGISGLVMHFVWLIVIGVCYFYPCAPNVSGGYGIAGFNVIPLTLAAFITTALLVARLWKRFWRETAIKID